MPTANYAVNATVTSDTTIDAPCVSAYNITSTGFSLYTTNTVNAIERSFTFTVNATNATLPSTFTEAEIQAVVDLAKSGSANGASAWGKVEPDGTLSGGLNISSVVANSSVYTVTFSTPMPDANYSVSGSCYYHGQPSNGFYTIQSQTTTGFVYETFNGAGAVAQNGIGFSVFATNITLPLTVTQAEIDTFKATATALQTALTRIAALEADHATAMNNMNNNNGGY